MKQIETELLKAKPIVPTLPDGFCVRVMRRIDDLGLAPGLAVEKSRQNSLLLFPGIVLLVMGAFLGSFVSFEINANGSMELLEFGNRFFGAFLSYLPTGTIVSTLLITLIAALLIRKSRSWKIPLKRFLFSAYFSIIAGGAAIASTGINDQLHTWVVTKENEVFILSDLYRKRMKYKVQRDDFQLGRVTAVQENSVWITDPLGQKQKILLPKGVNLAIDQFVKFTGKTVSDTFQAESFRFCNSNRVNSYFNHMKMHSEHMSGQKGMRHMMRMN